MTKIEWTDKVWNPLAGCSKVSAGCRNCYAEKMAKRLVAMGQDKYTGTVDERGLWTGKINLDEQALTLPLRTKKPTRFFVNSMSDLFHENVPDEWITRIFEVMYRAEQHTFQILTKRPKRMMEYLTSSITKKVYPGLPLPNVWLGVSVENQRAADERIPLLLQTPADVRFLSCEPLLGPVDLSRWMAQPPFYMADCEKCGYIASSQYFSGGDEDIICPKCYNSVCADGPAYDSKIDWVIVGGESGPNARPMHPDWARSLRDQCEGAGVPFFFKQWGEFVSVSEVVGDGAHHYFEDGATVRRVGKAKAGRTLDGRTWDEMPEVNE